MKTSSTLCCIAASAAALLAFGCKKDTPQNKAPSAMQMSVAGLQLSLGENNTATLKLQFTPENAIPGEVRWSSSAPQVAEVDQKGTVTAKSAGEADITAQCGSLKAVCKVTVSDSDAPSGQDDETPSGQEEAIRPTGVSLNESSIHLKKGVEGEDSFRLVASVQPQGATVDSISWASSDERVALVSEDGLVTAAGKGTATIFVTLNGDENLSASCEVDITQPLTGIRISKIYLLSRTGNRQQVDELTVGDIEPQGGTFIGVGMGYFRNRKYALEIAYEPEDVSESALGELEWVSRDTDVATVDASGQVSCGDGFAVGGTWIVASCGEFKDSIRATNLPGSGVGADGSLEEADLSVYWADINLGAKTNFGDRGKFFAWGETQPKDSYTPSNWKWRNGYDRATLRPEDDAAAVQLGHGWRMPTYEEFEELIAWFYDTGGSQLSAIGASGDEKNRMRLWDEESTGLKMSFLAGGNSDSPDGIHTHYLASGADSQGIHNLYIRWIGTGSSSIEDHDYVDFGIYKGDESRFCGDDLGYLLWNAEEAAYGYLIRPVHDK